MGEDFANTTLLTLCPDPDIWHRITSASHSPQAVDGAGDNNASTTQDQ